MKRYITTWCLSATLLFCACKDDTTNGNNKTFNNKQLIQDAVEKIVKPNV